ncbi:MAG: peptide chain release factor 3 [Trueperaceae bacterium]
MSSPAPAPVPPEVARRRTFAIISHPDAGKTTLTEKLLLYSGAIREAGIVGGKKGTKGATSDWMAMERERGISISSAALQVDYEGFVLNLLDTPGHQDFSEDTYRTLTAADSAVMLLDAARGVQEQTLKLFEVCRRRGLPTFTFINKLDRPARDPFDLLDEVEKVLGLATSPVTWPIGSGPDFRGVYDRPGRAVHLYERAERGGRAGVVAVGGVDDPHLAELLGVDAHARLVDEIETVEALLPPADPAAVLAAEVTPVFFGSVLNNFGVDIFLEHFVRLAPAPGDLHLLDGGTLPVAGPDFTAVVFKLQANLDKRHRDRTAYARIATGTFERGMTATHVRSGRTLRLARAHTLFAEERETIEVAHPGDVVGLVNPGLLRIGDVISTREGVAVAPLPRFAPEVFATVRTKDVQRDKAFRKGLDQLAEEGVIQRFYPAQGARDAVLGAVGQLQFEVFARRMRDEYGVEVILTAEAFTQVRWLDATPTSPGRFGKLVHDPDGAPAVLFRHAREIDYFQEEHPGLGVRSLPTL